jgi:hypothetical protein
MTLVLYFEWTVYFSFVGVWRSENVPDESRLCVCDESEPAI